MRSSKPKRKKCPTKNEPHDDRNTRLQRTKEREGRKGDGERRGDEMRPRHPGIPSYNGSLICFKMTMAEKCHVRTADLLRGFVGTNQVRMFERRGLRAILSCAPPPTASGRVVHGQGKKATRCNLTTETLQLGNQAAWPSGDSISEDLWERPLEPRDLDDHLRSERN